MEKLSKMRLREQDLNFLKQFGSPTTEDIKVLDSEELRVSGYYYTSVLFQDCLGGELVHHIFLDIRN